MDGTTTGDGGCDAVMVQEPNNFTIEKLDIHMNDDDTDDPVEVTCSYLAQIRPQAARLLAEEAEARPGPPSQKLILRLISRFVSVGCEKSADRNIQLERGQK